MTREGPIAGCYKSDDCEALFPNVSTLVLHPKCLPWVSLLTWSQTPFSATMAIADVALQHAMDEKDESGERRREKAIYRYLDAEMLRILRKVRMTFPDLTIWEIKSDCWVNRTQPLRMSHHKTSIIPLWVHWTHDQLLPTPPLQLLITHLPQLAQMVTASLEEAFSSARHDDRVFWDSAMMNKCWWIGEFNNVIAQRLMRKIKIRIKINGWRR